MMHASVEEGRTPLAQNQRSEGQLREQRLAKVSLYAVAIDAFLGPLFLLASSGFDLPAFFADQVGAWSLADSLADWLLIRSVRDALLLLAQMLPRIPGEEAASDASEDAAALRWARRAATVALLLWVMRAVMLEWTDVGALGRLLPFVVWESLAGALFVALAQLRLLAARRLRKESLAASSGADPEASAESQTSAAMTYYGMFRVLKPYFWPSSGTPSEVLLNRVHAVSTWVFVAGSKVANLFAPICLAHATTSLAEALRSGLVGGLPSAVGGYLALYAFLIFTSKALKEAQSLVYIRVQQAAYVEIADTTFQHLHSLSFEWHRLKKLGQVTRSIDRGVAAAQQTVQYVFLYLVPTLAEAVAVALIFLVRFKNLRLAVFMALNLTLYCYVTCKITLWRKRFRTATTKHDNELHERLTDSLVNYETVKCFTGEEYERQEYRKLVGKYQKYSMATQASLSFLNVLQQVVVNFALAGGMLLAASRLVEEHASSDWALGDFVAVNAYILNIFTPLNFLGTIYNMVVQAVVDMQSFGQLLAEQPEIRDAPGARDLSLAESREPMVEFSQVSFRYKSQPEAASLKEIGFRAARGSSVALVGHTGAGKSTITRLLLRFYDPSSGRVLVNGQDAKSVTQRSLRAAIGVVPQDVVMFNDTIGHNIRYGRIESATQCHAEEAAKGAQLSEFIEAQEKGFETVVGERGLKLSGGEKQRLAIARCLLKDPAVVILDEATSALDSRTESKIQEALAALSSQRTVLAVAHRLSTVRGFDQILVLESGQIMQRGTHDELVAVDGIYAEMWGRQARGGADDSNPGAGGAGLNLGAGVDAVAVAAVANGDGGGAARGHGSGHGHGHGHG